MATIAIQQSGGHSTSFEPVAVRESATTAPDSNDVVTKLNYYDDPGDGSEPPATYIGRPETYQLPMHEYPVTVHDIRGKEDQYTLDKNGFQIHHHRSAETDFLDEDKIKAEYYPEIEQLLKQATGASRVFIFDHTIRRPSGQSADQLRGPVNRVHVDQSYAAAKTRVPHHLPTEAERLLQGRYQIINVWRPIKKILKDPLGVADASSVAESDLVPVALIYPDRRGETLTVKPSPEHRWHYLYGQTPESS